MDATSLDIVYSSNLIAGLGAFVLLVYNGFTYQTAKLKVLPKSLRLFVATSLIPSAYVVSLGSVIFSAYYLVTKDENETIFKIIRVIIASAAQHFRGTLLFLVIERIVSTVFLDSHAAKTCSTFIILTIITYSTTILYTLPSITWIFFKALLFVYTYVAYLVVVIHLAIIIVAKVLYDRNKKMYSILAYRVNLRQRYQVVENIKVLALLWPTIIAFTAIAPIGVIGAFAYNFLTGRVAPTCLFLITYNLSIFIISVYLVLETAKQNKKNKVHMAKPARVIPVISPLGQKLPTFVTSDKYFEDLQKQWQ